MDIRHTQGPWKFMRGGLIVAQDESAIVGKFHVDTYSYNGDADRALIAAAPELLEALERILRAHDAKNNGAYMGEAVLCPMFAAQARYAISKAKGE